MRLGPPEIILILVVVILIFGVGKLPQIGKSLGEGLKSFKQGVAGEGEEAKNTEATETVAEQPKAEVAEMDAPAKVSEEDLTAFKKWQADQAKKG
ncbi:twin-arginine translocase TatA/TatE family subunit [Dehalogenimonas etheniformans]|uniref:Sec-independent protein translocase protein TatA n=1 Tax=Dehalogenimonas etheniformans TaxID=1536648 RepID=A0A2P5P6I4_9CHLR|nr:twin-arginine translocase TatA/TatE family subunit [Dehalogenimonas etheniformans]PPD57912.1 twin-arginine translocase TatA/TatE family subunit [Dehalogenimonas etheniformans]QNT75436.1 twin-arginine translocase TatA/TatE family subunit [Dehalogenimonas etheniformans]